MVLRFAWLIALLLSINPVNAEDLASLRVGVLRFGTASWEIETIRHHGLDRARGLAVEPVEFASNEAAKVALQAGAVDLIVTDWPWVSRQRGEGAAFQFVPYSRAVGTLLVPGESPIADIEDLRGKTIGVAGGPLDKSWLLLQALFRKQTGSSITDVVQPVFGAPPLLNEELARGRIDALLTYWHYAARLRSSGMRPVLDVSDMIKALGIVGDVPMLGYAFREEWAAEHGSDLERFLAASAQAKGLLATSEAEWRRLAPLVGSEDRVVLAALREGFRSGIPGRWGEVERRAAGDLFALLAATGGEKLVGRRPTLDPGTFWVPRAP